MYHKHTHLQWYLRESYNAYQSAQYVGTNCDQSYLANLMPPPPHPQNASILAIMLNTEGGHNALHYGHNYAYNENTL